jgi:plastocyanin
MKITRRSANLLCAIPIAFLGTTASAYEVVTVSDGGKIEGKVTFQGAVPTKKIIPNKDKEVCGGVREDPVMLVGADKGVQDAVVYLKEVPKGKAWGKEDKHPQINNKNCRFEPTVQVIRAGPIDILNSDPALHNTHGFYGKRTAFNLALPNEGDKITKSLDKPGQVRIECDSHGWMLGWVYVADSPYYAVTAKDGSFSLTDVPPGEYTLVAIQDYTGETETPVTVKPKETVKLAIELKKK